ncbi:hypothetical protein G6F65_020174 [Rhizopus arrhizus]|nr:hypothetical protein G6F65_020174 [Rhizopus arrhizus]
MPGQGLAIDPGGVTVQIKGTPTTAPAFGLPALWIDGGLRDQAQVAGYTVVDAGTVVATHLNHLMHRHGSNLLGRQEVQQLLDRIGRDAPKLVEDLVPKTLSLTALQKVLQGLLSEEVPIRDMRTIIDTLSEHGPRLAAQAAGSGGQPDIQHLGAVGQPTDGDLVDAGRRHLGGRLWRNAARRFRDGPAARHGDGAAQILQAHVVQQHHVHAQRQRHFQLRQGVHF